MAEDIDPRTEVTTAVMNESTTMASSVIHRLYEDLTLHDPTDDENAAGLDLAEISKSLRRLVREDFYTSANDILASQCHVLNHLFAVYLTRSLSVPDLERAQWYQDRALEAQRHCRMALSTLDRIKRPRIGVQNNYQVNINGGKLDRELARELLTSAAGAPLPIEMSVSREVYEDG